MILILREIIPGAPCSHPSTLFLFLGRCFWGAHDATDRSSVSPARVARARTYDLRSPSSCSGTLVLCSCFFGSGGLRAIRPRWRTFVPSITYVARTFARGEPDVGKGELCQIPCCPSFACADRLGPGGNRLSRPALLWRWRGSRHWFSSLWWWCVHTLICELIATASDTHNPHPHPFPPPTRKPERGLAGPWAVCFWSGGLGLEDRVMGCRAVERGHHVIRTFTRAKRD